MQFQQTDKGNFMSVGVSVHVKMILGILKAILGCIEIAIALNVLFPGCIGTLIAG